MRPLTYSIYSFYSGVLFYLSFSDVQNLDDAIALGASKSYSIYFRMIIGI